jgi:tetratricopeptide (TPR) repeat protein
MKVFKTTLNQFSLNKRGKADLENLMTMALRDILCASMSLDDALSTIQNFGMSGAEDTDLVFQIARVIEEIILRKSSLASAKLTELSVRLAFREDRMLPELLSLIDTRYTNSYRRNECEILPDINAIPQLLDMLSELNNAMILALKLNLRPLLPFLTDEALMTLNAIHQRYHNASTTLAVHEVHYLTWILSETGFFDCAEVLLNKLMKIAEEAKMDDLAFEIAFDEACVLTELGMYKEARKILVKLQSLAKKQKDKLKLAYVKLQMGLTDTRDDTISPELAKKAGDEAVELYRKVLKKGLVECEELGAALLSLGSNKLANGWREGVSQSVSRLQDALDLFDNIENRTESQNYYLFRCLASLGFAYGLLGGYENITVSINYFERAKSILVELEKKGHDQSRDLASCENALGWICLSSESDEYWPIASSSFKRAIEIREILRKKGLTGELELISTRVGFALSQLRNPEIPSNESQELLRSILVQYIPLFPTDSRASIELAIATYNLVWLTLRHGGLLTPRLLRLLEDIDTMLSDARAQEDSIFLQGACLLVPFLNESWRTLSEKAKRIISEDSELSEIARIIVAFTRAKLNLEAISLEAGIREIKSVDESVIEIDALLAQYWFGQTLLAQTIKSFYKNRDYSNLASGLYSASMALNMVSTLETEFSESVTFLQATCSSLSNVLLRFALALEERFSAEIEKWDAESPSVEQDSVENGKYDFVLTEDWLGIIKITEAYLQMVERAELAQAQPYLNAVFSNTTRALRMMDKVSLIDRRVLALLGEAMNRRFYLRS